LIVGVCARVRGFAAQADAQKAQSLSTRSLGRRIDQYGRKMSVLASAHREKLATQGGVITQTNRSFVRRRRDTCRMVD